jgi:hypothetical protein
MSTGSSSHLVDSLYYPANFTFLPKVVLETSLETLKLLQEK